MLVYQQKCLSGLTVGTGFGLLHFSVDQVDRDFGFAPDALECCSFHLRVNIAASDNDTSEGNEPVDVFFLQTAHNTDI
jgi:hypothetical protein